MKYCLLLLLLVSTACYADIGSVFELKGTAIIKRGKDTVTVVTGTKIELNDLVETKNGVVNIKFKDETTVKVTESSSLLIDDFVYDPKNGAGKLSLKATSGTVRYVSGNIAHNNPNAVNIKTPTAAIAVRGTDFVMAVNEAGSSTVLLMPSCENGLLGSAKCSSGKIDVSTGHGSVTLDKPYHATVVETSGTAPLTPVIVELGNAPVGNNLMLSPLKTAGGATIQQAAKQATERTGDSKKSTSPDKKEDDKKDNSPTVAEASTVDSGNQQAQQRQRDQAAADAQAARAIVDLSSLANAGVKINDANTGDPNVFEIHKNNNPNLQQTGWGYASLSSNGRNYANIALPVDTQILVVVTQDRVTDAYSFANGNKAYGSIIINQSYNTK